MRDATAPLPRMSVIVPTRDRPRELAACLASLSTQDYPDERYEIIVVDDGSDPPVGSLSAPGRPDVRVRAIAQRNAGPAAARNAGAGAATGDVLVFTDDDCVPRRGWLRALALSHANAPDALHGGRVENGLADNLCSVASHTIVEVIVSQLMEAGSESRFVTSNNLAVSAGSFRAIGGFDERFRTAEDREFCHRWIAAGVPLVAAPGAVVEHRHDLTLASFWRQHMGYGQGARCLRAARGAKAFPLWRGKARLYAMAFRRPFAAHPPRKALAVASLLVVWQVANLCGYASQWVRERRRTGGDRAGA